MRLELNKPEDVETLGKLVFAKVDKSNVEKTRVYAYRYLDLVLKAVLGFNTLTADKLVFVTNYHYNIKWKIICLKLILDSVTTLTTLPYIQCLILSIWQYDVLIKYLSFHNTANDRRSADKGQTN